MNARAITMSLADTKSRFVSISDNQNAQDFTELVQVKEKNPNLNHRRKHKSEKKGKVASAKNNVSETQPHQNKPRDTHEESVVLRDDPMPVEHNAMYRPKRVKASHGKKSPRKKHLISATHNKPSARSLSKIKS